MRIMLMSSDVSGYEIGPCSKRDIERLRKVTDESTVLFQTDWDFPALAQSLGWNMASGRGEKRCEHRSTDGTVQCRECGKTASEFIAEAAAWLDKHDGCTFQGRNVTAQDYIDNALGKY